MPIISFSRNKCKYELNPPNKVYNVTYLGNILSIVGKSEECVEKSLNFIWQTYNSRKPKRDIPMKLLVTRSGLKAQTKNGLIEYWAHRMTYCVAPKKFPCLFCWVYKHEGKLMKPEIRCHVVLCRKSSEPLIICTSLNEYLHSALLEYKREKLTLERARKNSLNGTIGPRRKTILQTGSLNFRTPVNRSKSAPRLGSIDEEDEVSTISDEVDRDNCNYKQNNDDQKSFSSNLSCDKNNSVFSDKFSNEYCDSPAVTSNNDCDEDSTSSLTFDDTLLDERSNFLQSVLLDNEKFLENLNEILNFNEKNYKKEENLDMISQFSSPISSKNKTSKQNFLVNNPTLAFTV